MKCNTDHFCNCAQGLSGDMCEIINECQNNGLYKNCDGNVGTCTFNGTHAGCNCNDGKKWKQKSESCEGQ